MDFFCYPPYFQCKVWIFLNFHFHRTFEMQKSQYSRKNSLLVNSWRKCKHAKATEGDFPLKYMKIMHFFVESDTNLFWKSQGCHGSENLSKLCILAPDCNFLKQNFNLCWAPRCIRLKLNNDFWSFTIFDAESPLVAER